MQIREGIRLALLQLRQEKLKSTFSLLGVAIGVTFLVIVVSVVEGMDRFITEDFAREVFGVNTVQVRRDPAVQILVGGEQSRELERRPHPTLAEARAVRGALSVPGRVGVETITTVEVWSEAGLRIENVQLSAVSAEILEIRAFELALGRGFSAQEEERGVPVAIVGSTVAEALFPEGEVLESRIRVRGFPYRVVGVLAEQGALFGVSLDNRLLVPAGSRAGRILLPIGSVGRIIVQAVDPADLPTAIADTEAAIRAERRLRAGEPNDFELSTAEASLAFWDQISRILFVALPALVGISLLVGGIVIMNIMLVSVMERTREIGVRKAVGAGRGEIVGQFLVEATTLSIVGALLGVAVALGLVGLVDALSPLPAAVAPRWVALGVLLGVGVGVGAGVYPALRASELDPVEALRHE